MLKLILWEWDKTKATVYDESGKLVMFNTSAYIAQAYVRGFEKVLDNRKGH